MSEILDSLTKKLKASGIHPLRQLGRAVGVYSPTNKKKEELIADILAIATNRADPVSNGNHRGAPPKSEDYDRALLSEVERCRRFYAGLTLPETEREFPVTQTAVASPEYSGEEEVYSGVLENDDKYWFVRTVKKGGADVFVHTNFISRFKLRTGDFIVCKAQKREGDEWPQVTCVISINGVEPENLRRVPFESLTPCYPDDRLTLEHTGCSLYERVIDLFAPIGKGQRALIVSPPKAGKTTLLKHIAGAILKNYPKVTVIIALIDERPEEVTDFRRALDGAEIFCSTFDRDDEHHTHTAGLALERAKRLVEMGGDVVLLLDSITGLVRACNSCADRSGKMLSDGLDAQALAWPKRLFGAARNTEEGGSLTIIASALIGTGRALDDIIYEEFASTCNMKVVLDGELAREGIFPATDIAQSGTMKDELLLSPEELAAARAVRAALLRGLRNTDVINYMAQTSDNLAFVANSKNFLEKFK